MSLRIPAPYRSAINEMKLRPWVRRRDFPLEAYFETVEDHRRIFRRHYPEAQDPDWEHLRAALTDFLDTEEALITYVLDKLELDVSDPDVWHRACEAAAYLILEKYEHDRMTAREEATHG